MKKFIVYTLAMVSIAGAVSADNLLSLKQPRQAATQSAALPGSNLRLGGALIYSDAWGEMKDGEYVNPITAGIYSIEARQGGSLSLIKQVQSMSKIKAAVLANNIFYTFQTIDGENTYDDVAFVTYSASTWNQSGSKEVTNDNLPSTLAYDPVSHKIYGFFYDEEERYFCRFGTLNTSTGTMTEIEFPNMDKRDGHAMAITDTGEIYAVWSALGKLIKLDPVKKTYDVIGRTGIYPGDPARGYINSMAYDPDTKMLYWASVDENSNGALYQIDPATASTTLIYNFPNNESFAGLYILDNKTPANAPAAVADLAVQFSSPGSTQGKVTFTAPALTYGGSPLTGNLTAEVTTGHGQLIYAGITPGQKFSTPILDFPEGSSQVSVTLCSGDLRGESTSISVMCGIDSPGQPQNLQLAIVDGNPSLTWDAPVSGANGGWFDPSSVRYRVTRLPDNVCVTQSIADTHFVDNTITRTMAVQYQVVAFNDKGESLPVLSQKVVVGDGYSLPFTETFETADDFNLWTVVDLNGQTTWEYDASAKNIFSKYTTPDYAVDDWIISPQFRLEAGKSYALTFDSKVYNKSYPENFSFWLGTSTSPEDMTVKICEKLDYRVTSFENNRVIFQSPGDGMYHLGLYSNSIPHHWQLTVDNIGISEIDARVPCKITEVTATPGEKGALSADLSFTLPITDSRNNPLNDKLTVKISRDGTEVSTLTDQQPGSVITWHDDVPKSGIHVYRIWAQTEAGAGEAAEISVYVGVDAPGAVGNLKAVETTQGIVLSWTAPDKGANGGWFDPAKVTYRIVRSTDAEVLASDLTDTSFTDSSLKLNKQELLYYLVTPYVDGMKGTYATTPMNQVYGPAYSAPFAETFAGADMTHYPWVSESDGPSYCWSLDAAGVNPPASDHNGDQGLATFVSSAETIGINGLFYSPKISVASLKNPELSFWMYHSQAEADANEALHVSIASNSGEFTELNDGVVLKDNGETGWQRHAFALPEAVKDSEYIRILFSAKAFGDSNFYLDDIRVDQAKSVDVEVSNLRFSSRVAVNSKMPVSFMVSNNGTQDISGTKALIRLNNQTLAQCDIPTLKAGASSLQQTEFSVTATGQYTITLSVEAKDDADLSNNTIDRKLTVVDPALNAVEDIEVQTYNGLVNLSWTSPMSHGAVSDDFESYQDWAIDGIGDWTMADRDYDNTYHIKKDLETYPNDYSPKAFQVCNAALLGIDIWEQGQPASGNKMLMAMACINRANNDWMISPMLNGTAQTVTFKAKSFTTDDVAPERFRVWAGASPEPEQMVCINADGYELTDLSQYIEVPEQWTEYAYRLPEGTRYFAIQCVSNDSFALFVDDVTFNDLTVPATVIDRYEMLRNGQRVATVTTPTFIDNDKTAGTRRYKIRTYYTNGMYRDSKEVTMEISAIDELLADGAYPRGLDSGSADYEAALSRIFDLDKTVAIYSVDGMIISTAATHDDLSLLSPGLYLLRTSLATLPLLRR